jgi:hypothetical protein
MGITYSFAALQNNIVTRKFGGTISGVANPYLSGTFFVWFENIPTALLKYTSQGRSGISDTGTIQNILAASCLSVTPPGGTLNSVEFTGLGGIKWTMPTSIDVPSSVSAKFLEFENTPQLDIWHGWIKMIRDYRLGISDVLNDQGDGSGFTKKTFAATMYYWTTSPDGATVQQYACFDGCYPTKDPQDLYSGDVENVGKLEVEQEFKFDYAWHEPWVLDKCQTYARKFMGAKSAITTINYV